MVNRRRAEACLGMRVPGLKSSSFSDDVVKRSRGLPMTEGLENNGASSYKSVSVRDQLSGSPRVFPCGDMRIYLGDSLPLCASWPRPVAIVVDGPYGIGSFPGDPPTVEGLSDWYEPHMRKWSERATPQTTLWFWNTELGWATVHPLFLRYDWEYRTCHVWNKGRGHVAGNANTKTLRKFPVVTEVCVQYVRKVRLPLDGKMLPLKEWLRAEWLRTGLPLSVTNEACGVRNAATRKYFTKCHLWYFPPPDHFERLVTFANSNGKKQGRPYFSLDGKRPLTGEQWERMRAKFHCEYGVNNVWSEPPMRGDERLKKKSKCLHQNQKPLKLIELILRASTDIGDVVWEPFGGLCSTAVAAYKLRRKCYSAEILPSYFEAACLRLKSYAAKIPTPSETGASAEQLAALRTVRSRAAGDLRTPRLF